MLMGHRISILRNRTSSSKASRANSHARIFRMKSSSEHDDERKIALTFAQTIDGAMPSNLYSIESSEISKQNDPFLINEDRPYSDAEHGEGVKV